MIIASIALLLGLAGVPESTATEADLEVLLQAGIDTIIDCCEVA